MLAHLKMYIADFVPLDFRPFRLFEYEIDKKMQYDFPK